MVELLVDAYDGWLDLEDARRTAGAPAPPARPAGRPERIKRPADDP